MRTDGGFAMVRRETEGFWRHCRFRGSQQCPALCPWPGFLPLCREEASALFIACGGLLWETGPGMDVWLLARLPPMRKERVGGNDASLPRRARICCRCADSTLFAPAGQKRFRVGAPDFGRVAGESGAWSALPIRNGWQARRENGKRAATAAGGKPLLVGLSPSARTAAPSGTNRSLSAPARGADRRQPRANGTGSRHCRPGGLCPHPLKGFIP